MKIPNMKVPETENETAGCDRSLDAEVLAAQQPVRFFQNCSSRREEAPYSMQFVKFEPRYLGCYGVLKEAPVLVDLWNTWCGPCRMIAPVIHELAQEYAGRARVVKLNVGENPETAARFSVASIPTLLIFKNGRLVDRITGFTSEKTVTARPDAQLN